MTTGDLQLAAMATKQEKFESEMKESEGDIANIEADNDGIERNDNIKERELSIWTKVVGGPIKGRIYGLGSEACSSITHTFGSTSTQPTMNQDSLEQLEMMRQEVLKERQEREEMRQEVLKERQEREKLQSTVSNLEAMVQQLLANSGLPTPPTQSPRYPSAGSNTIRNKDT